MQCTEGLSTDSIVVRLSVKLVVWCGVVLYVGRVRLSFFPVCRRRRRGYSTCQYGDRGYVSNTVHPFPSAQALSLCMSLQKRVRCKQGARTSKRQDRTEGTRRSPLLQALWGTESCSTGITPFSNSSHLVPFRGLLLANGGYVCTTMGYGYVTFLSRIARQNGTRSLILRSSELAMYGAPLRG
jgi:hypothetical protein